MGGRDVVALDLREPACRVSPRARWLWQVEAVVLAGLVGAALLWAAPAWGLIERRWWWTVPAVLLLAAYAVVEPAWRYRVHRWEVTDRAVYTQTGWWVRERRVAPVSRIQTVDQAEGAVARLFGLATVTVTTASAAGALEIPGLARHDAQALVARLTEAADAEDGDAT